MRCPVSTLLWKCSFDPALGIHDHCTVIHSVANTWRRVWVESIDANQRICSLKDKSILLEDYPLVGILAGADA